jgi:hypothetical protein
MKFRIRIKTPRVCFRGIAFGEERAVREAQRLLMGSVSPVWETFEQDGAMGIRVRGTKREPGKPCGCGGS